MQPAGAEARDQALDQRQVHATDEVAVLGGQLVEWAVAQPDGAIFVLARLEAVAAQGVRCGLAGCFAAGIGGPAALSQAGPELLGGVVQRGPACGTPVGFDRHREQAGRQFVLPGGTVTANSFPERAYTLAGRPAPGPPRPAGRW